MQKQILKNIILTIAVILFAVCAGSTCSTQAATVKLSASSKTIYIGSKYTLKVTGTSKTVKWTTSDKSIATVSSKGVVTGKKTGTVTITAKVNSGKLTCKVKVWPSYMKYFKGTWYTNGGQPYPTKVKFSPKCIYYYECDWETGEYSSTATKKEVSYEKTNYGYYVIVYGESGFDSSGYRMYIDDDGEGSDVLECTGEGNPYSTDFYSGSGSLSRN